MAIWEHVRNGEFSTRPRFVARSADARERARQRGNLHGKHDLAHDLPPACGDGRECKPFDLREAQTAEDLAQGGCERTRAHAQGLGDRPQRPRPTSDTVHGRNGRGRCQSTDTALTASVIALARDVDSIATQLSRRWCQSRDTATRVLFGVRGEAWPFRRYAGAVPELPEVEAWVRELAPLVSRAPVAAAGPAHIATLKTFEPPISALEGRRLAGAERRGKNLLLPTDDGELVLRVHLMSAGRLRYLAPGAKGPKQPMFRLRFADGGEVVLTEAGKKKRAGVWLYTPDSLDEELAHLGPEALGLERDRLREILGRERRQLHPLLRDQRALAGIGRAHANEILWRAQLSPFALSTQLDGEEIERLGAAVEEDLARALELRERGKGDADVYLVHGRFGEPCPRCGATLRRVDFEEHTITYCPGCQTGGKVLKDRRLSRLLR